MTDTEPTGAVDEKDDKADRHSDDALVRQVKKHKKESDQHLGEWREEARDCYAFVAGDQWTEEEKAQLLQALRIPVVFNRIDPMVQAVAGSEVNNRQQVQYVPRQAGDSGVNEVLTGAADYFREACDAEDEESDAFMDLIIAGVGVTETCLDYIDNPEGMVHIDRRDPLSMRWDPAAKKRNLADRAWDQREEWMSQEQIEDKWPDKADEIGAGSDWAAEEGKPIDQSLAWLYEKDNTGSDEKSGKLRVIHEQWFELETYHALLDFGSDQVVNMEPKQFAKLKARTDKLGIPLKAVKKQRKQWFEVFVCGDVVLEFGKIECNEPARKFMTGHRDRNRNVWYGIVKAMLDPQKWANKFFSQFLHIINTNAKGGMVIEKSATDNLRKFKADWAKSDGVTVVEDGAISKRRLMPKPIPAIPPQMSQMMEFAISSLRDVSGLNLEILGMADRQQAGVLEAQRKQAALTVLSTLFDALRRYRKEQGRLMAKYITEYLSDGRLIRIVGGDGTEKYVPLIHQQGTLEYDVIVDESANTVNQKDKTFHVMTQLLPMLEKMGAPFTPDLLDYMPIPAAMAEKWKAAIKQKMQQPPQPDPRMLAAQGAAMTGQANMAKAQGQLQKNAQETQLAPAEMALRTQELRVQQQELGVRSAEAQAAMVDSVAHARTAQMQSLGFSSPGVPGISQHPAGAFPH